MKKLLLSSLTILAIAVPSIAFAYSVPWNGTTTLNTLIFPTAVNGVRQIPFVDYYIATSTTRASTFPYASTTALTVSGSSYLGNVLSGSWGGTAIPFANGGTGLTSASDDTTLVSNGSAWVASTLPNCVDTSGNHLNYTSATNAFSCGSSSSGGGGGGGTDLNWSFFNNSGIRIATSSNQVLASSAGQTATSTLAKLEVAFNSAAGGSIFAYGSTTLQNFTALNSTSTNATTTSLGVTNIKSALHLGDANGSVTAYAGSANCTNQVINGISAVGAGNCVSVSNAMLSNSSITINTGTGLYGGGIVSLGGTLTLQPQLATSSVPTIGNLAYYTGAGTPTTLGTVGTSSASCSSGVSCSGFTVVGGVSPSITNSGVTSIVAGTGINVSGATGAVTVNQTSYVATSSGETAGNLAYYTSTNGTPATLGKVATTSITCSGFLTCTGFTALGSASTITTTGQLTVASGGTGASTFGQGWIYSTGGTTALNASTSPTVNYITATSTTVASSFVYASTTLITSSLVYKYSGFSIATTTTFTGSTTEQQLYTPVLAETWLGATCNTLGVGTVNVQFFNNSAKMNMIPASSTPAFYTLTTNNAIAAMATTTFIVGTPASSPTSVHCDIKRLAPMQ